MRPPLPHRRAGVQINMTPMIDVTFLLIIFFLLSSHLAQQETQLELDLPLASSGRHAAESERPRLSVNVRTDGGVMLGSTQAKPGEMERRLQIERQRLGSDLEVRVRADRSVPFRAVEPVLLACAEAGIWNVTFAVFKRVENQEPRTPGTTSND
jgi:biopolymer transport protein ExbD